MVHIYSKNEIFSARYRSQFLSKKFTFFHFKDILPFRFSSHHFWISSMVSWWSWGHSKDFPKVDRNNRSKLIPSFPQYNANCDEETWRKVQWRNFAEKNSAETLKLNIFTCRFQINLEPLLDMFYQAYFYSRSSLIHFAYIGVAPPRLFTPQVQGIKNIHRSLWRCPSKSGWMVDGYIFQKAS